MCSIIDSFLLLHFVCSEIWLPDVMKKKELFLKSLFSSSEPHFNNLAMFYETYSLVLLDKKTLIPPTNFINLSVSKKTWEPKVAYIVKNWFKTLPFLQMDGNDTALKSRNSPASRRIFVLKKHSWHCERKKSSAGFCTSCYLSICFLCQMCMTS